MNISLKVVAKIEMNWKSIHWTVVASQKKEDKKYGSAVTN